MSYSSLKFHPSNPAVNGLEEYRQLAEEHENMSFVIEDHNITKYQIMADVMISDTSSTVYEFLLLNKPVITVQDRSQRYLLDRIYNSRTNSPTPIEHALQDDRARTQNANGSSTTTTPIWTGKFATVCLTAAGDYISRHGVPKKRKLNLWRKYTSIKKFGKIKRR